MGSTDTPSNGVFSSAFQSRNSSCIRGSISIAGRSTCPSRSMSSGLRIRSWHHAFPIPEKYVEESNTNFATITCGLPNSWKLSRYRCAVVLNSDR